jgi:iron(III) transport system ATP-binding protein
MIWIEKLAKSFSSKAGQARALAGVDLAVEAGEFFVLLGPSGSGKTTLLRCVAGLERPDSGEIVLGSRTVFSSQQHVFVAAERREVGMGFQSYAIWPHLTVFENVALPLSQGRRRLSKAAVREQVHKALRLVEIDDYAERPAPLLSGGQQQRVALARALAINPKLLLMDEPLSNLDARLREDVRGKIKKLASDLGITVLYVTHDQVEAMVLADRIAVMAHGEVLQVGNAVELYRNPKNPLVAEFFGSINWLHGELLSKHVAQTEIGKLEIDAQDGANQKVIIGIRPEDMKIDAPEGACGNRLDATVTSSTFIGDQLIIEVKIDRRVLTAKAAPDGEKLQGRVSILLPKEKLVVFHDIALE